MLYKQTISNFRTLGYTNRILEKSKEQDEKTMEECLEEDEMMKLLEDEGSDR